MSDAKRYLDTSLGHTGEELITFPDNYIQPSLINKKRIQAGYLDLLYYEYRVEVSEKIEGWGQIALVLAVAVYAARGHAEIVSIVLAVIGLVLIARNWGKAKTFGRHRRDIEAELQRLGVGAQDQQLADNPISSTTWGQLHDRTVSHLGVVRPVTTKGFPEDMHYVFNVFEDKVYR